MKRNGKNMGVFLLMAIIAMVVSACGSRNIAKFVLYMDAMFLNCFGLDGATCCDSDRTDFSMTKPSTGYFTGEGKLEDHVFENVITVIVPTCTEAGYTTYTCACGHSFTGDKTAPLGHSYGLTVENLAQTEQGYAE